MKIAGFEIRRARSEERRSVENPNAPLTFENIFSAFKEQFQTPAGISVSAGDAMRIPGFSAAVTFFANTIAKLPLHVMSRDGENRRRDTRNPLNTLLRDQPNEEQSSFEWRMNGIVSQVLRGRWLSQIERNERGAVINIWPIDPAKTVIERISGRKRYIVRTNGVDIAYDASEIIDIPWLLDSDGITAFSPFIALRNTIGLAMGIENYAAAFFRNGGVPPLSLEGNFQTGEAVQRASEDITRALKKINAEKGSILPIPVNHKLVKLGSDPEKGQMVDAQRFIIEQIARGFNLPPVFLQDLTHGTFSNNEQQDLHLTKHTLSGMIKKIEAELNLKLFGRSNTKKFVQFNLDALMRGEFAARMGGYQTAINSGVMTPAEARQIEDLPFKPGSDRLFIQGANVPIDGGSEKKGSSDE